MPLWRHFGNTFFGLLVLYFYGIENKSPIEYVLLTFSALGFILDIFYTYIFYKSTK